MADEWADWWRKRGDERLSLLLWAVWNPIGPVPLNEYANYTGQVVSVLRRAYDDGQELWPSGSTWGDGLQERRNEHAAASVKELASLLDGFRCDRMGGASNPDADRAVAKTLTEWYRWEMEALTTPG
ncbi:MAG TPA: hypothetical protein VGI69_11995 [Gaiellaceae bacterium]